MLEAPDPEKSPAALNRRPDSDPAEPAASDMPADGWIDHRIPGWARPYLKLARLDRPVGIWLLLAPCWWGVALASAGRPPLDILIALACGAVVMRGAGCTINDIIDRDIDAKVARTAARPLACGQIKLAGALVFLAGQLLLGLAALLTLNTFTILLALAVMPLVALYPLAKRHTDWPQAVLGLTFNWGVLVGWAAVRGELSWEPVLLYLAGAFWTLGYDTIYAHQDKADDVAVGVKSSALRLGLHSRAGVAAFYAAAVGLLAGGGWLAGSAWPFYGGLALAACHFAWQTVKVDFNDPGDCLAKFRSNQTAGLIIFAAILLGGTG